MRELPFTQKLLSKALSHAPDAGRIRAVSVLIGEISELDPRQIEQHWRELGKGTPAEHAQLHFRFIKAEVQCMACFGKYHPVNGEIHCPHCGSYGAKILTGEEFDLESIELEET